MASLPARRRTHSIFPDLAEFFGPFPATGIRSPFGGNLIRVEDKIEAGRYVLRAELPGLDPAKDIKVTIEHGQLTIEAERTEERSESGRSEFSYGSFSRTVTLPNGAKEDDVDADYAKGILTVSIGIETAEPAAKTIEIKSTE